MNLIKNDIFLKLSSILLIFTLDRISKIYVLNFFSENQMSEIYLFEFLNIYLIWNEGIAFGLLSFKGGLYYQIITLLILLIIITLLILIIRPKTKINEKIGYILITGGAVGNFYDRVVYKAVPDFIDLHLGNFHWFIFNIADIFITIGILWLILIEIILKKKNENTI